MQSRSTFAPCRSDWQGVNQVNAHVIHGSCSIGLALRNFVATTSSLGTRQFLSLLACSLPDQRYQEDHAKTDDAITYYQL